MALLKSANNLARRRIAKPGWLKPFRPVLDFDFANQRYFIRGRAVEPLSLCTFTRATVAWYDRGDGVWVQAASGAMRITPGKGYVVEPAHTNVCLQNRDLTNASWTKSNVTATKDQTGIDGVTNSASKIVATAGNGTCLQSITLASSSRRQSTFVKRITGSGNIDMTTDNGSTWTTLTVTSDWAQVQIPAQTVTNPVVGFRIVTNGDAVAIDMVQNHADGPANSTNGMGTPIVTAGASVTRNADTLTLPVSEIPFFNATQGTMFIEGIQPTIAAGSTAGTFATLNDTTVNNRIELRASNGGFIVGLLFNASVNDGSVSSSVLTNNARGRGAMSWFLNDIKGSFASDGIRLVSAGDSSSLIPTVTRLEFGSRVGGTFLLGYLSRVTLWDVPMIYDQIDTLVDCGFGR